MKIKSDYKLRKVADTYIIVAMGDESKRFNGIIRTNETGAFIWEMLEQDCKIEAIADAMAENFDVDIKNAETDLSEFLERLKEVDILEA